MKTGEALSQRFVSINAHYVCIYYTGDLGYHGVSNVLKIYRDEKFPVTYIGIHRGNECLRIMNSRGVLSSLILSLLSLYGHVS